MAAKMFNVRVDDDLRAAIDKAAEAEGVSTSQWAREVLALAARGIDSQQPHPQRFLALQASQMRRASVNGDCQHPKTAIRELPFTDVCGVCGVVVRTR